MDDISEIDTALLYAISAMIIRDAIKDSTRISTTVDACLDALVKEIEENSHVDHE